MSTPTTKLTLAIDPKLITWSRHDSPPPALCSLCHGALGEVPLTIWDSAGNAASFCDCCADRVITAGVEKP